VSSAVYIAYKLAKVFIYPLTWILALLAFALVWSRPSHLRRARICLVLALALAYALSIAPVSHALVRSLERMYPPDPGRAHAGDTSYEAVVVLAGGVERKGGLRPRDTLAPASLHRLLCGRELMLRGLARTLVLSGGNADPFQDATPEASIMAETLKAWGPATWAVQTETRSRTTYENAVETRKLLHDRARVALVTSAMHMPRSMAFFRRQGLDATAFPCEFAVGGPPSNGMQFIPSVVHLGLSTLAINEWVGLGLYRLAGKAD
jgi:uncharacterized SAM-binding protein YcdF (DUF218 family)